MLFRAAVTSASQLTCVTPTLSQARTPSLCPMTVPRDEQQPVEANVCSIWFAFYTSYVVIIVLLCSGTGGCVALTEYGSYVGRYGHGLWLQLRFERIARM